MPLMNAVGMNTADRPNATAMTAGVTSSIALYVASRGASPCSIHRSTFLDHDDRVVDHDADRQHQSEQRQVVEREPQQVEHRAGADERHRHGDERDHARPPALQEHDHDDDDEQDRLAERLEHVGQRLADEDGRVVGDRVLQARREVLLQLDHLRVDGVGRLDRVAAGELEDRQRDGGASVEVGVDAVVLRPERDVAHVAQADDPPALAALDDDVLELLRVGQPPLRVDRELVVGRPRRQRLLAEHAGGDLHVLVADRLDDVAGGQPHAGDLLGVQPDAHGVVAGAEQVHVAHPRQPGDLVAHLQQQVVGLVERVVARLARLGVVERRVAVELHDERDVGAALADVDAEAPDLLGQPRLGDGDAVLHLHLGRVEVRAELERDGQAQLPVVRRVRAHVEHVLDAVDLLLDRRRDGVGDHLRVGAGVAGADDDGGRDDLGVLRDRQDVGGDAADDHQHDRQHRREHRAVDEEVGKLHGRSPLRRGEGLTTEARGRKTREVTV